MGKLIDADQLVGIARNIAAMANADAKQVDQFADTFKFIVNLAPEANDICGGKDEDGSRGTGEWGEIIKIGASMAYGCRKCGKSVVQPLAKTTYRFCPHCGAENGEREVE